MEICYSILNPTGNITALVESPVERAQYQTAAAVIMTLNMVYLLMTEILHHARPFGNPHGRGVVSAPAEDVAEASATSR